MVINPIEKMLVQNFINSYKRPLTKCVGNESLGCLGLPSGHAEIVTIVMVILLLKQYVNMFVCVLIIIIVCLQRLIYNKHTINQIVIGIILGLSYALVYSFLYEKFGFLSIIGFTVLITIFLIVIITVHVNNKMKSHIPTWLDHELYYIIDKKTNIHFFHKCLNVVANIIVYNMSLYCSWNDFERHMNKLIEKTSAYNYDMIVGIKSGGAFMANYIGKSLGKNYTYVKMSKKCNKNTFDSIVNVIDNLTKSNVKFSMCDPIHMDLTNMNILLLDETSDSGRTFLNTRDYLINEKKVAKVTCACFYANPKIKQLFGDNLITINPYGYILYPWGFDN